MDYNAKTLRYRMERSLYPLAGVLHSTLVGLGVPSNISQLVVTDIWPDFVCSLRLSLLLKTCFWMAFLLHSLLLIPPATVVS